MPYIGRTKSNNIRTQRFIADGVRKIYQTEFIPVSDNQLSIYIDGVYLNDQDFVFKHPPWVWLGINDQISLWFDLGSWRTGPQVWQDSSKDQIGKASRSADFHPRPRTPVVGPTIPDLAFPDFLKMMVLRPQNGRAQCLKNWWNSKKVQESRNIFCEKKINYPLDII